MIMINILEFGVIRFKHNIYKTVECSIHLKVQGQKPEMKLKWTNTPCHFIGKITFFRPKIMKA